MRIWRNTQWIVAIVLLAVAPASFAKESVLAIVGGTVVDLEGDQPIRDAVVLVKGERVDRVGKRDSVSIPEGARIVDMAGKWLLPGLMNMHVHLGLKLPGKQTMELADETDVELVLRAARNGRDTLLSGTTTIRDTGDPRRASIAFDKAVKRGDFIGPRIYSVGKPICPTGGHCAGLVGTDNGAVAVMESVRREMWKDATWIKLKVSGGISDRSGSIAASDMTLEEMRAAVDTAHRHGVKVTAHTGSPAATLEALEAGVDCFEHGYYLTKKVFEDMKEAGAWYVPTIVVTEKGALEFFEKIGSPQWYLDRVESVGKAHWKALQAAIDVEVDIAMGTDQFPFEPNGGTVASVREIELYVDAGMTPVEALRAATVNAARMLGAEQDLGAVEEGKYADIIAVSSDPIDDIRALRTIGFVMKGGEVVRNDWAVAD
jgi:imidazolonepropionase-like amidohydrolase